MAAIRPCTGTTEQWKAVSGTLILKDREIGVEIATRKNGTNYTIIRQGDGESDFFDLKAIFDQSSYEDALSETRNNAALVKDFSQNMVAATSGATEAATTANKAATVAQAAATACEGALNGMNTMVDTETGKSVVMSIENNLITLREA